jgi:linoleate 8R-lipoxygenase / 9,12-octadecadienoate 8-hydroperoxide 8R-isomerase
VLLAGDMYRSSDGSGYPRTFDNLGKAGSRYSISARVRRPFKELPDANVIFDKVMARDKFKPHPAGISSTLFYLALIITHDLFNTSHDDPNYNSNSSYLDLSPLYGSNIDQQNSIRTFKYGLLKADTFADSRILLQPPGVGTLLILFSRNHNFIVRKLLEINERNRFSNSDPKKQDEDLFQTARLINCGYYVKIVLHNYLRAILGIDQTKSPYIIDPTIPYSKSWLLPALPTGVGNLVSLEFNYIYRWHPAISQQDEKWIEENFFKDTLGVQRPDDVSVIITHNNYSF